MSLLGSYSGGLYKSGIQLQKHKVFVSYHHANDQVYGNAFEALFAQQHGVFLSKSVKIGGIDAFQRRKIATPDNSYPNFVNNKTSARWK